MKYAILFTAAGVLLIFSALQHGGGFLLLFWPAVSCFSVAFAYRTGNPQVFGKRSDGTFERLRLILLLPYLSITWLAWQTLRCFSRQSPIQTLCPELLIGRRLLPSEFDRRIDLIVDLTCELSEPKRNRDRCEYWSFPVLDASVPREEEAILWAIRVARYPGTVFIHCAQGHGRTGTLAALVLLVKRHVTSIPDAIQLLQKTRPTLRLNTRQTEFLNRVAHALAERQIEIPQV